MKDEIEYQDFEKLDLRIAKVIQVDEVEGADKLLKLTLDVGEELGTRIVMAGIKQWYRAQELEGRLVLYLANLKPRTLRGVVSQGMIIAGGKEVVRLLKPDVKGDEGSLIGVEVR